MGLGLHRGLFHNWPTPFHDALAGPWILAPPCPGIGRRQRHQTAASLRIGSRMGLLEEYSHFAAITSADPSEDPELMTTIEAPIRDGHRTLEGQLDPVD